MDINETNTYDKKDDDVPEVMLVKKSHIKETLRDISPY